MASALLRAARNAPLAAAAAAAASRSACAAGAVPAAARYASGAADYAHVPDDANKTPTDEDMESEEAMWALYERWLRAHNKERDRDDHAEMARRFKLFRNSAERVHQWNTDVPADPWEAAVYLGKRREAELLAERGDDDVDVSHLDEIHERGELGPFADGGDPYLRECDMSLMKRIEDRERERRLKEIQDAERDAGSSAV